MLSTLAQSVRRTDPDRFFTALFAPPAARETLLLLYAFNHELARARAVASEPTIALIRLHWWREVVQGADCRHEIAAPLAAALADGTLHAADLLAMIDGREAEADEQISDTAAWHAYLAATAGTLSVAAGRLLGAADASLDALRALGAAYGAAGVLRAVPALARQHRCLLPADLLAAHGLSPHAVTADPTAPALRPVLTALAMEGLALLAAGRAVRLPRACLAAALPATLARRDLRRVRRGRPVVGPRGLGDRLAVLAAAATGRP
jgi:phytoene synthase